MKYGEAPATLGRPGGSTSVFRLSGGGGREQDEKGTEGSLIDWQRSAVEAQEAILPGGEGAGF